MQAKSFKSKLNLVEQTNKKRKLKQWIPVGRKKKAAEQTWNIARGRSRKETNCDGTKDIHKQLFISYFDLLTLGLYRQQLSASKAHSKMNLLLRT